ncbi:response regulator [Haloplanus natans]|uniref:response regulator n=1 Tax=Haloplanus natans TaxID=376171 RepID=UPI000677CE14|nr:PAS domain S-box protein [Haloplanus natans]
MDGSESGSIRVLHVDDDPQFSELTAAFLGRTDDRLRVEVASRADEALDRIDDRSPDCIVSDYNMPGMDGIEFLRAVRDRWPQRPFVLFTGKGSEDVASEAISAGVTDYLQKGSGTEQYELLANRITNAVDARRDARRAARQDELMRLTEFAGDTGGWQLDPASDALLLTDGTRRLLDHPEADEFSLDDALDFYHPDDRDDVRAALDRALDSGTETRGTWRVRTAEGHERLVDVTIIPVSDDGDEVSLLRGSVHDITERREREQRFRAFVERSTDVISVVDADGRFTYQSPSLERVLGYDPEETLGDLAFEYMHPDDRTAIAEQFERLVAETDATPVLEYRARHADGSWRWIEARGNNQLSNPAVQGYVVNSRDITDRKEREEELGRIGARYRALVENVPAVFLLFDETLRYRVAGGTDLADLHHTPSEIEGSTSHDLFPAAVADEVTAAYRAALDGIPQTFERTHGGRQYRVRTVPVRDDDGAVVSGLDISRRVSK